MGTTPTVVPEPSLRVDSMCVASAGGTGFNCGGGTLGWSARVMFRSPEVFREDVVLLGIAAARLCRALFLWREERGAVSWVVDVHGP